RSIYSETIHRNPAPRKTTGCARRQTSRLSPRNGRGTRAPVGPLARRGWTAALSGEQEMRWHCPPEPPGWSRCSGKTVVGSIRRTFCRPGRVVAVRSRDRMVQDPADVLAGAEGHQGGEGGEVAVDGGVGAAAAGVAGLLQEAVPEGGDGRRADL